jgi:hypothetical protein
MSQIPFVQKLGDTLERAAAARTGAGRRRFRQRLLGGALAFGLIAVGAAAATGVFSNHEQLATTSIYCYDGPSLSSGATGLSAGDRSPVETCRDVLHASGPLTACAASDHVAVLPGGPGVCRRAGLALLPDAYGSFRTRVRALEREIEAIEASATCLPPSELAGRVQALLDRSGWSGWRTEVRSDVSDGPCGSVTTPGGDGSRTLDASLNADRRVVYVFGGP